MAKRKSRAARKEQRVKVRRAEAHGLPAPELPQPVKKAPRDSVVRDEFARKSPAAAGARAERVAAANQSSGLPTIYKVLIGAAAAIGLIFGLSQLRKSDPVAAQEPANHADSNSRDLSTSALAQPVPADAPVAVIDATSALDRASLDEDTELDDHTEDNSSDASPTDAARDAKGESTSQGVEAVVPSPAAIPVAVAPAADFTAPAKSKATVTASPIPPIKPRAVESKVVAPSEPRAPSVEKPVLVGPSAPTVTPPPTVAAPVTPQTPPVPKTPPAPPTPGASESE